MQTLSFIDSVPPSKLVASLQTAASSSFAVAARDLPPSFIVVKAASRLGLDMAIEASLSPMEPLVPWVPSLVVITSPSAIVVTTSSAITATASCTSIVTINYCRLPSFQESS